MPIENHSGAGIHQPTNILIIGQGLAGSLLAWELKQRGQQVMVVDNGATNSASRVAAGLINPITGQRLVKTSNVDVYLPIALEYYQHLEQFFQTQFYHPKPLLRLFSSVAELDRFKSHFDNNEYAGYVSEIVSPGESDEPVNDNYGGVLQAQTGYLDIPLLLENLKVYFQQNEIYLQTELNLDDLIGDEHGFQWQGYQFDQVVFCNGAGALTTHYFSWLPFQLAKGEIVKIKSTNYYPEKIIAAANWIVPVDKPYCKVGATYEWVWSDELPTDNAKQQLLKAYQDLTDDEGAKVVEHSAGIRPATKDKQPFMGRHPVDSRINVFNGFGSKGALTIPFYAQHYSKYLTEGGDLLGHVDIARFDVTNSPVVIAKRLLSQYIKPGDLVIDATVGNGNDTLALAVSVGEKGKVIGFDIQEVALENTRKLLSRYNLLNRVELVHVGHERISEHIPETLKQQFKAIVFNLGYLPGGDKSVSTQAPTTVIALDRALNYLMSGGVMTVVCYPNHPGGQQELQATWEWSKKLSSELFQVRRFVGGENLETAPQLFFIRFHLPKTKRY